ncbi:MAG: hypothetical protein CMK27_00550 [Porticoccaceae bacterium]|jgi:hypothetical protein|nr:hypothetical protein [Porticoccaceae bacterium]|tara:strand:- start:573 stop:827 length:255 start_codon:yes stop_codon:yes gene_type:complete
MQSKFKRGLEMKKTRAKRKFAKVPKTSGGVPKKYVSGAKNKKSREAEIKKTAKLYKKGKLTPSMMNKITKMRSKSAKKSSKKKK